MVQKSDASTIGDLAQAVKELFHADNEIKIIGLVMEKSYMKHFLQKKSM